MQTAFENLSSESAIPLPQADSTGDDLLRMALAYSTGQGGAPVDLGS